MSSLAYLLPVWGGCEGFLIRSLQVLQNRAARQVTRLNWYTPVRRLLTQCNWLSVKQLVLYHSALAVYRTSKSGLPVYLDQHLRSEYPYNTRQGAGGAIRLTGNYNSQVESSFLKRAANSYNEIPGDIRSSRTLPVFKRKLKFWIKTNIPYE